MTTRRIVIGKRSDGTEGIFVSKAGFDAYSTADANLVMNISSKVSVLLLLGTVSSTQVISLGLSRSPTVLVTSENSLQNTIAGYTGPGGPARPSPLLTLTPDGHGGYIVGQAPASSATINSNGASMTVSCSVATVYAVYSKAFT